LTRRWSVLVVEAPGGLEDEVAAALAQHGLGAEVGPESAGAVPVRVYLDEDVDASRWLARGRDVLAAHGVEGGAVRLEALEDGRWVERYQEALRPLPLGRRFVVIPGEHVEPIAGREPLVLVPGMAFGTGEHPTTRLCAEALESTVEPHASWLDLGCGTAILALVAIRCGASRVLAVDPDPEAVRVAREVVERNGGAGGIVVREGSTEARGAESFRGVVANIAASFFLRESGALAACVLPGGWAIVSGFLEEDLPEIEASLGEAGLDVVDRAVSPPWALLRARRVSA
jgi:ribosomal protein L11 methyltransferase